MERVASPYKFLGKASDWPSLGQALNVYPNNSLQLGMAGPCCTKWLQKLCGEVCVQTWGVVTERNNDAPVSHFTLCPPQEQRALCTRLVLAHVWHSAPHT